MHQRRGQGLRKVDLSNRLHRTSVLTDNSRLVHVRYIVPEVLLAPRRSQLLPDKLQHFPSKLGGTASDAQQLAKDVLTCIYKAAQGGSADKICVPLPPKEAIQACIPSLLCAKHAGAAIAGCLLESTSPRRWSMETDIFFRYIYLLACIAQKSS